MKTNKPLVSIGMPVLDGEKYIRESFDSILAQTHSDFELIISDNASDDGTQEICKSYAKRDPRIRYYRNEKNLGAARNFNRVFELSSGRYFKWAAHDDVIAPEFLERCVKELEGDASLVLCHTRTIYIDEAGRTLGNYAISLNRTGSLRPQDRFGDLIRFDYWCHEVFGLIRASALAKTRLIGGFIGSDRNLLAELGLIGRFHEIPEYLFFSRDHPDRSIRAMPAPHMRREWFDPTGKGQTVFPHWRNFIEFVKSVKRASLSRSERASCYIKMAFWFGKTWNWIRLITDLIVAVYPGFWNIFSRVRESRRKITPPAPYSKDFKRRTKSIAGDNIS